MKKSKVPPRVQMCLLGQKFPLQILISQKNELDCISMIFLHYEITISAKWHKQIIKTQAEPKYE